MGRPRALSRDPPCPPLSISSKRTIAIPTPRRSTSSRRARQGKTRFGPRPSRIESLAKRFEAKHFKAEGGRADTKQMHLPSFEHALLSVHSVEITQGTQEISPRSQLAYHFECGLSLPCRRARCLHVLASHLAARTERSERSVT